VYGPRIILYSTLLLLLRVGTHLLAEGEVRNFQAGERPNADKEDEEQGNDGCETHEQSRCEVLVSLEKTTSVCGVGALYMGREIPLEFELLVVSERSLHLVWGVLVLELCFDHLLVDWRSNVDDGVVLGLCNELVDLVV
jgi:hypothetical protein